MLAVLHYLHLPSLLGTQVNKEPDRLAVRLDGREYAVISDKFLIKLPHGNWAVCQEPEAMRRVGMHLQTVSAFLERKVKGLD